jgi:ABC-2 type transport system permease protein
MNLLRAEFRKLSTTQVWFWLMIGNLALIALQVIIGIATLSSQADYIRNAQSIYNSAGTSFIFVMVLGIIGITAEFRHQTITPTLLTTPSRSAVVISKLVSYLIVGAVYAAIGIVFTFAIAVPWLSAKGYDLELTQHGIPRSVFAAFLVAALYALLGVGIGSLITNQAAAITLSIIYSLLLEGLISAIPGVRKVYPYLPGGGARAMLVSARDRVQDNYTLLTPLAGAAVLIGWALLLSLTGVWRMKRDIS